MQRRRICVEVGGKVQHAGPGDLLKVAKGVPHRFIGMYEGGAVVLTITTGTDVESFVGDASVPFEGGTHETLMPPTDTEIARQSAAAIRNGLELLGPPMSLADLGLRAT